MPLILPTTNETLPSSDSCSPMWPQGDTTDGSNSMWSLGITDSNSIMWPQTQWPYCIYLIVPFDGCVIVFDSLNYDFTQSTSIDFNFSNNIDLDYIFQTITNAEYVYSCPMEQLEFNYLTEYYADFEQYFLIEINFDFSETIIPDLEYMPDTDTLDIPINIDFVGIKEYDVNTNFTVNFTTDFQANSQVSRVDFCYV